MFPNAQDGKFPGFFWENSGSQEMAFGNTDLYLKLLDLVDKTFPETAVFVSKVVP